MNYGFKPLYPPPGDCCGRDQCMRLPLFNCDSPMPPRDPCGCAQTVRLENPCCPGECALVSLSVDSCGNLVLCVRREPPRCDCRPKLPNRC